VVFDKTFEPIFCTQKARHLLKVPADKFIPKVWLRKNGTVKTFKHVVSQLKNGETEGWIGKKVDNCG